jgi:hypothetical protein
VTPQSNCGTEAPGGIYTLAAAHGPGNSCTISVQFDPLATGARSALLTVSGTPDATQPAVTLTGMGVLPVTVTPATLPFGSQALGTGSPLMPVMITNHQSSTANGLGFTITGTNGGDFDQVPATAPAMPCTSSLAAGATCMIDIKFVPTATGFRSAVFSVTGTPNATQPTVSLSGTGVR